MDTDKKRNLAISVDSDTYAAISALSTALKTSRRQVVRDAIREKFDRVNPMSVRPMDCCHGTDGQHVE